MKRKVGLIVAGSLLIVAFPALPLWRPKPRRLERGCPIPIRFSPCLSSWQSIQRTGVRMKLTNVSDTAIHLFGVALAFWDKNDQRLLTYPNSYALSPA
jgi:hypothetical protein